jgi:ketosteroid isomerase-like protein
MSEPTGREVIDAYVAAMNAGDWEAVGELLHPDFYEDYPQSGERIRGRENCVRVRRDYPRTESTPLETGTRFIVGGDDRWAIAPNFTAVRIAGAGDTLTAVFRARYPDGLWYIVHIGTVENGRLARATVFFAPLFDPPEWRQDFVERMPEAER